MDNAFAGSEMVELSILIEKNGFAFYTELAGKSRDPLVAKLFVFLAREEEKHITALGKLCEKAEGCQSPQGSSDEYIAYMSALASEHIFTQGGQGEKIARMIKTDGEALDKATGFEKDSIIFYEGMRSAVPADDARIVDALIAQEKSHLLKLVDIKKKKLKA